MQNYTFEIHTYAPEINKIYYKGVDITKNFGALNKALNKNYLYNVRLVRNEINKKRDLIEYKLYEISKQYADQKYECYNDKYKGYISSYSDLINFKKVMASKLIKDAKCELIFKRIYKY